MWGVEQPTPPITLIERDGRRRVPPRRRTALEWAGLAPLYAIGIGLSALCLYPFWCLASLWWE